MLLVLSDGKRVETISDDEDGGSWVFNCIFIHLLEFVQKFMFGH